MSATPTARVPLDAELEDRLSRLAPRDLGLPARFTEFRRVQREGARFALLGPNGDITDVRKFHAMGIPPGGGKSLLSQLIGTLSPGRFVTLTASRSLEDQYVRDEFQLANVRGRSNYPCGDAGVRDEVTCEDGAEEHCSLTGSPECTYGCFVDEANRLRSILTNYQYWMNVRQQNPLALCGSGPIETLICDEAHLIPSQLGQFLTTWIANNEFRQYAGAAYKEELKACRGSEWGRVNEGWRNLISTAVGAIDAAMERIVAEAVEELSKEGQNRFMDEERLWSKARGLVARYSRVYRKLDKRQRVFAKLVKLVDWDWVWKFEGQGVVFEPIWPGRYSYFLWSGVPHIIPMSATLRPKQLDMSFIAKADRWYHEWPRIFPPHLSPVVFVKGRTYKMGAKAGDEERAGCVGLLDEMADLWEGRRGIVHTPSYKLAEQIFAASRHARRMVMNARGSGREGSAEAERKYRETPGAILLSPSFQVGSDFPDSACEFQFIPKLPFPDKSNPAIALRMKEDKTYYNSETMQKFVQSCYRGTRHGGDRCTTVVGDAAVVNFRYYAGEFGPKWFRVGERDTVPGPPK